MKENEIKYICIAKYIPQLPKLFGLLFRFFPPSFGKMKLFLNSINKVTDYNVNRAQHHSLKQFLP